MNNVVTILLLVVLALLVLGARVALLMRNRRRYVVREIPGFLSEEECAHLIERARPLIKKSKVAFEGKRSSEHIDRESATAFIAQAGDPIIHGIKQRIAELSETKIEQQERIQVTYYGENQRYDLHYDALAAARVDPGDAGDRICTVIMYLNDDFDGGATYFPRIRQRIRAEKGKAVIFRNLNEDGTSYDRLAMHAGERIGGGEKWLSNQWIRQHRRHSPARSRMRAGGQRKGPRRSR